MSRAPGRDDVEPVVHEARDRLITALVTAVPILALGFVAWQLWEEALRWSDVIVFVVLYLGFGLGVTVGFHRLLTHRSFETTRWMRFLFGVLGSAAIEGPAIAWVADHRKHHAFSDREGDPHSPHVGHGVGLRGALCGLAHAHVGWLFIHTQRGAKRRYAPDLLADPIVCLVDRTFVVWAALGCRGRVRAGGRGRAFAHGGCHGSAMGRRGARARCAPRHLQRQLALSLFRAPAFRDGR